MADKTDEEYAVEAINLAMGLLEKSSIPVAYWREVGWIVSQVFGAGMLAGAEVSRQEYRNAVKRHTERN